MGIQQSQDLVRIKLFENQGTYFYFFFKNEETFNLKRLATLRQYLILPL